MRCVGWEDGLSGSEVRPTRNLTLLEVRIPKLAAQQSNLASVQHLVTGTPKKHQQLGPGKRKGIEPRRPVIHHGPANHPDRDGGAHRSVDLARDRAAGGADWRPPAGRWRRRGASFRGTIGVGLIGKRGAFVLQRPDSRLETRRFLEFP